MISVVAFVLNECIIVNLRAIAFFKRETDDIYCFETGHNFIF